MDKDKREIMLNIWETQNNSRKLMDEYDSRLHTYGEHILYHAEANLIDLIGYNPGITVTDLSKEVGKTPSACSQVVRKLKEKGWVKQRRNVNNNRQFKLELTESGKKVFKDHVGYDRDQQEMVFEKLSQFSTSDLSVFLQVQQRINEIYMEDKEKSQ